MIIFSYTRGHVNYLSRIFTVKSLDDKKDKGTKSKLFYIKSINTSKVRLITGYDCFASKKK